MLAAQDHCPLAKEYSYTPQSLSIVISESRSGKYSSARQQSGLEDCETAGIVLVHDCEGMLYCATVFDENSRK